MTVNVVNTSFTFLLVVVSEWVETVTCPSSQCATPMPVVAQTDPLLAVPEVDQLSSVTMPEVPYHPPADIIEPQVIADGTTKKTK